MDARNGGVLYAEIIVGMSADAIGAKFEVNQLRI